MDINRIALYLAGKFPPYYNVPFDKFELIELLRAQSPQGFSDDFFKLIDSQDFYSMCLNRIKRVDETSLIEIIKSLNIPEDAGWLKKRDLIGEKLQELKKEYEEMELMTDVYNRGYKFEIWLKNLFEVFELKPRASYKTAIDQIDGSFELDGKEYLLEAKWIKKPVDKSIVDVMFGGELSRCLIGTVGVIISHSGFNSNSKIAAQWHKNILLLTKENLFSVLEGQISLNDLLRKLRRNMAEKGLPYLENI